MAIKWINKNVRKNGSTKDVTLKVYKIKGKDVGVIRFRNGCVSLFQTVEFGIDDNRLYMRFGELTTINCYSLYSMTSRIKSVNSSNEELLQWIRTYGGEYQLKKDGSLHFIEGVK